VVLTAIADQPGPPEALAYFGDLDMRGLEIAAAGARLAAELTLPPLNPAGQLYRFLLDHGQPAPAGTYPSLEKARAAVIWLPAPLRDPVLSILVAGNRLAQEAVGRELLARTEVLSVTGSAFFAGPCPADPQRCQLPS
jgi:hypothetical protein